MAINLSGRLEDDLGAPVVGATVTAISLTDLLTKGTTSTTNEGKWAFVGLPEDTYRIKVSTTSGQVVSLYGDAEVQYKSVHLAEEVTLQAATPRKRWNLAAGMLVVPSGTAFPTDPAPLDGDTFYRTDLDLLFVHDVGSGTWKVAGVPPEHTHTGGADGAVLDHDNLTDKGTNTHAEIDAHLAASAPHSGHATVVDLDAHAAATVAHGAAGAVVGTTNTQTISNKTLKSLKLGYREVAGNTTITWDDAVLYVNGAFSVTLPVADNDHKGQKFEIIAANGTVTLPASGGQSILDATWVSSLSFPTGDVIGVICTGSGWKVD